MRTQRGASMNVPMAIDHQAGLSAIVRDEARFRDWYDATLPRVHRYLAARCGGDDALAEELTQQTYVSAIRARHRFDERSDVVTWLCAIGRNKLVDHYRRHGREARRHDRLVAELRLGHDSAWRAHETRDAVQAAMAILPAEQRLGLLFHYLDGLSVREVASALGRSQKATESLLTRARANFRRAYGGQTDA